MIALQLVSHTADPELAEDWLSLAPGLEGVVAKRPDGRYWPGRRDWVKIKRHHTVDCAVVGIAGEVATPKLVLALRHPDGRLLHLGRRTVSSVMFVRRACRFTTGHGVFRRDRAQLQTAFFGDQPWPRCTRAARSAWTRYLV